MRVCSGRQWQRIGNTVRRLARAMGSGALVCAVIGCSTTGSAPPMAGKSISNSATLEQRLEALEADLQQLTRRVDLLQATAGDSADGGRAGESRARRLPASYRPVQPDIVLASGPVRKTPVLSADTPPAPAGVPEQPPAPVQRPSRRGGWVINLASYTSRTFAGRKQAEFIAAGVAVEQVQAEVNGGTVYRLCVPGFKSFRAANAQAQVIRQRLGLDDFWVARR